MRSKLDIGRQHIPGGYFLAKPKWRGGKPFVPDAGPARAAKYRHCFSYEGADGTIRQRCIELIRGAKQKIFIASFRIGDVELLEALHEAAERLRGGVYVISALDERSFVRGLQELDEAAGIDLQAQQKDFTDLARHGIYVRGHEACHAKFMVVDDEVALVSSANLETRAFDVTGENGVAVTDASQVLRLAHFFTRLWFEQCTWEIPPSAGATTVAKRRPEPAPCDVVYRQLRKGCITWTDGENHHLLRAIHETIASARKELLLSTFSLEGMVDHPQLLLEPLQAIIDAYSPRVRMLVRVRNHFASQRRDAEALAAMGVEIIPDDRNHAKGVIADSTRGVLFSANFDARHGLTNGVEVGTILPPASDAVRDAVQFFEHSMAQAGFVFEVAPTHRKLASSLAAGWTARWPLRRELDLHVSDHDWDQLCDNAGSQPVLFHREAGRLLLHAGKSQFRLDTETEVATLTLGGEPAPNDSLETLTQWLKWHGPKTGRGGICPAVFRRV